MAGIKHCCRYMAFQVERECQEHPTPYDCPERLVVWEPFPSAYGLVVHDGSGSFVGIRFCPWCGKKINHDEMWDKDFEGE